MKFQFTLVLLGLLCGRAFAENPEPTHKDVSYGPDERNVIDFWKAEGEGPRPLLVYIHGGGWTTGDKSKPSGVLPDFPFYLDRGISCAAFNYRLTPEHPLPAPVHDAARAIQFLRTKSREWNVQKDRIVLTGGSAGACTSMWLLCHDDLADPDSTNPVARESTRVQGAAVSVGQTSIDPKQIVDWLGPKVLEHRMIHKAVGGASMEAVMENYESYRELYEEFSAYNHVSGDDPSLAMSYGNDMTLPSKNGGHGIHHGVYGVKMKEKCDAEGQECHLFIPGVSESGKYETPEAFLLDLLLGEVPD
ncbi:MAG: alpha/beta hydrolase [Verrucomicrobiales bacterium]|nr:alpha/beta hydrolase [Verrucomicrobiales bacterium]